MLLLNLFQLGPLGALLGAPLCLFGVPLPFLLSSFLSCLLRVGFLPLCECNMQPPKSVPVLLKEARGFLRDQDYILLQNEQHLDLAKDICMLKNVNFFGSRVPSAPFPLHFWVTEGLDSPPTAIPQEAGECHNRNVGFGTRSGPRPHLYCFLAL